MKIGQIAPLMESVPPRLYGGTERVVSYRFLPYHVAMLDEMRRRGDTFDVLHFHLDFLHYPLVHDFADRSVTTLHGRLDAVDIDDLYAAFDDLPLVSISYDRRRPMPPVNWVGCVHHGLPRELLPLNAGSRAGYLAFLGRNSPEKRPDRARCVHAGRKFILLYTG